MLSLTVVDHPLVQHKLSIMRDRDTPPGIFRQLLRELALLIGYEVTRDLPTATRHIQTPVRPMDAPFLAEEPPVLVSILRAGNGLLDGMLDLMPDARVGHVGLYRDPQSLEAVEYYFKVPEDIRDHAVIVLDPMLATSNSAIAAVQRLKDVGAQRIKMVSLLAAPEGIENFQRHHANVPIYTAAIDERLNEHGYIVPGLGDAGDRLYGTQ